MRTFDTRLLTICFLEIISILKFLVALPSDRLIKDVSETLVIGPNCEMRVFKSEALKVSRGCFKNIKAFLGLNIVRLESNTTVLSGNHLTKLHLQKPTILQTAESLLWTFD